MSLYAWVVIGLCAQFGVSYIFPERVGKGRVLSRPMWTWPVFRLGVYRSWATGNLRADLFRSMQMIACWGLVLVLLIGFRLTTALNVYWIVVAAFYADDYLTGDDDRWKRFKDFVTNKVKWKATRPAPAALGGSS